jgi:G3E family GTPase
MRDIRVPGNHSRRKSRNIDTRGGKFVEHSGTATSCISELTLPTRLGHSAAAADEANVRTKGYFWLATHNDAVGEWSQAGAISRHGRAGTWWAAVPEASWPQEREARMLIRSRWNEHFGDRQQELVLIGTGMDEAALHAAFNSCLLSDDEFANPESSWSKFVDPFPDWSR